MAIVAERAFTSRSTLQRVAAGHASVSIGIYAGVLQALGMLEGLGNLADIGNDPTGQVLASAALPKRIHLAPPPQDRGMADFEVQLDLYDEVLLVGLARSNRVRGGDRMMTRTKSIQAESLLRITSLAHKPSNLRVLDSMLREIAARKIEPWSTKPATMI